MLIVLGVIGSIVGLWDAFDRMNERHEALLEVNEFSSVKNGSIHSGHAPTSTTPISSLETLSTIVLSNISIAKENLDKLSKAGNFAQEKIQTSTIHESNNVVNATVAVPPSVIEGTLPGKSGPTTTKDTAEPLSSSGSLSEIDSSVDNAKAPLGIGVKGTNSISGSTPLKDASIDKSEKNSEKTVSVQKAADASSQTKPLVPGTQQNLIPKGGKT